MTLPESVINSVDEIIVIDNGSDDDTAVWAERAIQKRCDPKFALLRNPRNYGYGGSHKVAFDYFLSRRMDYAILYHGDGQGDSEALKELIRMAQENRWDFVIGSRFKDIARLSGRYSLGRRWGNLFFVWLQKIVSGLNITDPGSGEVAYSLNFIKRHIPYRQLTDSFHFTPQLLLHASRRKVSITEIPISWGEVETSSANIYRHAWNMLKMLVRFRLSGRLDAFRS